MHPPTPTPPTHPPTEGMGWMPKHSVYLKLASNSCSLRKFQTFSDAKVSDGSAGWSAAVGPPQMPPPPPRWIL